MTHCTKCNTPIKNVIMIDNRPYGTECATTVLEINQLPTWFKGGDWNKAKAEYDNKSDLLKSDFSNSKEITSKAWGQWVKLSKAVKKARSNGNEWASDFISNIISQLGYPGYLSNTKFDSMEEAESNWGNGHGSFIYLNREPKALECLSDKQLSILNKFLKP